VYFILEISLDTVTSKYWRFWAEDESGSGHLWDLFGNLCHVTELIGLQGPIHHFCFLTLVKLDNLKTRQAWCVLLLEHVSCKKKYVESSPLPYCHLLKKSSAVLKPFKVVLRCRLLQLCLLTSNIMTLMVSYYVCTLRSPRQSRRVFTAEK
jgi:hypothetical protein